MHDVPRGRKGWIVENEVLQDFWAREQRGEDMDENIKEEIKDRFSSLRITEQPLLVREQAFERLRDAIINGRFPPGTRLIERELCEALGVSRTSIREALRRLEAQRLINVEPRRGPTVAHLTRLQAEQIYEIRSFLEGMLMEYFVQRATQKQVRMLRTIFRRFEEAATDQDIPAAVAIMARFYDHITAVAGAEVISDVLQQLTARVSFLRSTTMSQKGRIAHSVTEIRAIIEAVEEGDAKAAHRAAIHHVEQAAKVALAHLDLI